MCDDVTLHVVTNVIPYMYQVIVSVNVCTPLYTGTLHVCTIKRRDALKAKGQETHKEHPGVQCVDCTAVGGGTRVPVRAVTSLAAATPTGHTDRQSNRGVARGP